MDTLLSRRDRIWEVTKREIRLLTSRPLFIFCMVIAPLFCYIFFTTLMSDGLPKEMPAGVVDLDNSSTSRKLVRNLDVFAQTKVVAHYESVSEAREAMQRGEIYGYYYFPQDLGKELISQRQPKISFYTNYSYLIAGSLQFRDMKMLGELASGGAARQILYAKGATEDQAMGFLRPIVIETHAISNPWINYSIYLSNGILPGILSLLILMVTVCTIGIEIKNGTAQEWLKTAGDSIYVALSGKLLPHTVIWMIMGFLYNIYLYGYLGFPCQSGIGTMLLATTLLILASQAMGIFMIGTFPMLRLGLSFASLWGVISLSVAGFSFPVMAMPKMIQALSILFPLRHFFLIYADQALNGFAMIYSWGNYVALSAFLLLPFIVLNRLHNALRYNTYVP
ncbi:ABC transporter permease [Porphyromonas sp.]|uniref:ABC transporter permease n=1 Tax=Porphyromonas sp. TaxID=1924944 RepID=UPI0026DD2484|nr:ABC transporter permease [Porphyromonas sp.]MDO4771215.1 ABC transporter permease [Porphyromonas sp.]